MSSMTISIYIPIIRGKTTDEFVKSVFQYKNIGEVLRVDFVFNKVKQRIEAFVHLKTYEHSQEATDFINSIENAEEQTKLFYNENSYWPILKNRNPDKKVVNDDYLNFGDTKEELLKIKEQVEHLTKLVEARNKPRECWMDDTTYSMNYPPISDVKRTKSR